MNGWKFLFFLESFLRDSEMEKMLGLFTVSNIKGMITRDGLFEKCLTASCFDIEVIKKINYKSSNPLLTTLLIIPFQGQTRK
jgi:hypothetical protein